MNLFFDIGSVLFLLVEVGFMFYFERKIWKTYYTPLNFLMVPFVVVFLLTLLTPPVLGYPDIYFQSLIVWQVGLIVFFIPSLCLGTLLYKKTKLLEVPFSFPATKPISNGLYVLVSILILIIFVRLILFSKATEYTIGSDDFSDEFAKFGFWGHALLWLIAAEIYMIASIVKNQKTWLSLLLCFFIVVFAMINQSKSLVIIPIFVVLIAMLVQQRIHLKLKWLLLIPLIGVFFFFISYFIAYLAWDAPDDYSFIHQVSRSFTNYFTAGIQGLSGDMSVGILETKNVKNVFASIVNFFNFCSKEPYVTSINDNYVYGFTNIRTMLGTLFVYSGTFVSVLYLFIMSSLLYLLRMVVLSTKSFVLLLIDACYCALLFMGWFDFYFPLLDAIEIPMCILIVAFIDNFLKSGFLKKDI